MWAEKVDDSAIAVARHLTPEGIDRTRFLPVAAIAIWSGQGRVALARDESGHGLTFPISEELPIIKNGGPAEIAQEIANIVSPMAANLGIDPRCANRIAGLVSHQDVSVLLQGCIAGGGQRQISVLPFGLMLSNSPNLRNLSWYGPSDAINHFENSGSHLQLATKHLMLRRLLSGHLHFAA